MGKRQTHELRNRALFTAFVVAIYLLGRNVPLYGVVTDASTGAAGGQYFLALLVSGDRYRSTMMALGIAPYINASLLVQVIFAFRSSASRAKVSKVRSDRWMLRVAVAFGALMAVMQSYSLTLSAEAGPAWAVRLTVVAEMLAGALLTTWLCMLNEKRGIGASMPIVLVNIIGPLVRGLGDDHFLDFPDIMLVCLVAIVGTAFMENSLIRLPLQRVSIHNVHADQNYLAYKRSPMGIMPVMFASSAFLLPYFLVNMLANLNPQDAALAAARDDLVLTRPLGASVYLALIVLLSLLFSFLMLNPRETAHQLQRNGDSIVGMYAGRQTARYLTGLVLRWSLVSGLLQAAVMAVSLALSLGGAIPASLATTPASMMILASIACSLVQEVGSYHRYDAYRFFM